MRKFSLTFLFSILVICAFAQKTTRGVALNSITKQGFTQQDFQANVQKVARYFLMTFNNNSLYLDENHQVPVSQTAETTSKGLDASEKESIDDSLVFPSFTAEGN